MVNCTWLSRGAVLRFILRYLFRGRSRSRGRNLRITPDLVRPVTKDASPSVWSQPSLPSVTEVVQTLPPVVTGRCYVIDGDTIEIGTVRLRLAGIDAPELDHPWGKKAKSELMNLCKGQIVRAEISPALSYDRVVATCFLPDGRDISAEMVQRGMALDWPKFSGGKYAHLEPEGVRRKHWKAAARQRGHMSVFHK